MTNKTTLEDLFKDLNESVLLTCSDARAECYEKIKKSFNQAKWDMQCEHLTCDHLWMLPMTGELPWCSRCGMKKQLNKLS